MKKYLGIRIAGVIILIAMFSYVAYKTYDTAHRVGTAIGKMVVTNDVPSEYFNLFKKDVNITYQETHFDNNKNRNPVSDLIFEDKYVVFITKIKTIDHLNSLPSIAEQFHEAETSNDIPYSTVSRSDYSEFEYFLDTLSATSISLTFYGDSIRSLIKNDTVEGYYLRNKEFAINYKKDGVVNLFMKTTKSEYSVPTVLLFLIHQKTLYFICISVRDPNDKLDMKVINTLINIPAPG